MTSAAIEDGVTDMGCRIGMATNVQTRVAELMQAGLVPNYARYQILGTGLTYTSANALEISERAKCGPHCQGNPGGNSSVETSGTSIVLIGNEWSGLE